jgi:hypothetical protein
MHKTKLQILRRLEQVLSQAREDISEACQLIADFNGEGLEKIATDCEKLNSDLQELWTSVVGQLEEEREQRKRKR